MIKNKDGFKSRKASATQMKRAAERLLYWSIWEILLRFFEHKCSWLAYQSRRSGEFAVSESQPISGVFQDKRQVWVAAIHLLREVHFLLSLIRYRGEQIGH